MTILTTEGQECFSTVLPAWESRRTKGTWSFPRDIPENEGNVIFPEGNALKYLAAYFTENRPENPYVEDPRDVRCLSFAANGDVLDGNVYDEDIMEIIKRYDPQK